MPIEFHIKNTKAPTFTICRVPHVFTHILIQLSSNYSFSPAYYVWYNNTNNNNTKHFLSCLMLVSWPSACVPNRNEQYKHKYKHTNIITDYGQMFASRLFTEIWFPFEHKLTVKCGLSSHFILFKKQFKRQLQRGCDWSLKWQTHVSCVSDWIKFILKNISG